MTVSKVPPGLALKAVLRGHQARIAKPAWSPDGKTLASGSDDATVRIWDARDGTPIYTLTMGDVPIGRVAWSPNGRCLAAGDANGSVAVWDARTAERVCSISPPNAGNRLWNAIGFDWLTDRPLIRCIDWSPDSQELAIASDDFTVRRWKVPESAPEIVFRAQDRVTSVAYSPAGNVLAAGTDDAIVALLGEPGHSPPLLTGHSSYVMDLAWSHDGSLLASASGDRTVRIWNTATQQTLAILEDHHGLVGGVSFSFDDRLLASKCDDDKVRLWRTDRWELVATLDEEVYAGSSLWHDSISFHPELPILATLGEQDRVIRIWEIDTARLLNIQSASVCFKFATAILAGDSGVGKSGLFKVLTGQEFAATESTHGREVGQLAHFTAEREDGVKEIRELTLWDLAGQPGYRLVHQLSLSRAQTVAVVFDARNTDDPFSGVRYWGRAIDQAQRSRRSVSPCLRLLVSARVDRGGIPAPRKSIGDVVAAGSFGQFYETSSKNGLGVRELREGILRSIDWDAIPPVTSSRLYLAVRRFLAAESANGTTLAVLQDLQRGFERYEGKPVLTVEEKRTFASCLTALETHYLVRFVGYADLVLLRPEVLDAYAAALVIAAGNAADGLGALREEQVMGRHFVPEREFRILSEEHERLLLIAALDEMLRAELVMRVPTEDGVFLVFPSETRQSRPLNSFVPAFRTKYSFQGATQAIYSTLVVRLAHCGMYDGFEVWHGGAAFRSVAGGNGVLELQDGFEGRGDLTLSADSSFGSENLAGLQLYIRRHLERHAVAQSVAVQDCVVCSACGTPVSEVQVQRRRERNLTWINCNVCDTRLSLGTPRAGGRAAGEALVSQMDGAANRRRDEIVAANVVRGKEEARDFDVFLAHNRRDRDQVVTLARLLRARGLNPWLDSEQVAPGRWFQDVIQSAIRMVRSAAIIIGADGVGKWERLELRTFLSECIEHDIPIIPVLLPGAPELPDELPFLRELHCVQFRREMEEEEVLGRLEWGIRGTRSAPSHLMTD